MGDRLWIVVGDTTDSGGTVLAGAPTTDVDGKAVARVGDPVLCGRHGQTSIASGDSTLLIDGKPVAREKDKCACGCTLLSRGQGRAFMSTGSSASPSRSSTGAAAAIGTVAALVSRGAAVAHPHPHTPVTTDGRAGRHGGDSEKARSATRDADKALRDAGAFRAYDTEVEAARAWRDHVLPVADDHQVEIGSLITKTPDGRYHLGPTYSNGAYDNVNGLIEHGQYVDGQRTAYIHTHPYPGGGVGAQRALAWGEELTPLRGADGQIALIGGLNAGGDNRGDLVTGYFERLNVYIADSAGLHGWNLAEYERLQRSEPRPVNLGEAYRIYGP